MHIALFLRKHVVPALLILAIIIGTGVRFLGLDAMEFKGDEYKAFGLAAEYLQRGMLPQVGLQSSTGLYNPPFFLILLWPAVLITLDPVLVTGWVVLLNAAGIIGLFFFLRRIGGTNLALGTTAIIATAPWLFIFSRKIWAQDLLFPFLVLTGWLLIAYVRDRRTWQLWGASLSMSLLTQLHMSAWAMPFTVVLWLTLLRAWPRWRDAATAAVVFLIPYVPYILFHLQDGFENLRSAMTQDAAGPLAQLRWMVGINGAVGLEYMWGPAAPAAIPSWLIRGTEAATWLLGIGAAAGAIISVKRILERSSTLRKPGHLSALDQYVLLLLCLAVLSHCGFLALGVPALPFYHLVFLPLIPLLCNVALAALPRYAFPAAMVFLMIIVGSFLALTLYFRAVTLEHPEQLMGDYGIPYRDARDDWEPYIRSVRRGRMRMLGEID